MLLSLGLDSQFGTLQGVVQCFVDLKLFPNLRKEIMTGKSTSITILVLHNSRFHILIVPMNDDKFFQVIKIIKLGKNLCRNEKSYVGILLLDIRIPT